MNIESLIRNSRDYYADMFLSNQASKLVKKDFKGNGGFTIVEMVMVVVIMSIMFTVGAASYSEYQQRQYVESAVSMVEDDLKLARQLSLSGRKPAGCDQFDGYAIQMVEYDSDLDGTNDPDENIYSIGAVCGNNRCQNNSGTDYCIKENIPLPRGVEMYGVVGFPSNLVTFLSSGRGLGEGIVSPQPTSDTAVITFRYSGSGVADRTITIRSSGSIEVN